MTAILDGCYQQRNIDKFSPQVQYHKSFEEIIKNTPHQLKKKMVKISNNVFSLTFTSQNSISSIQYYITIEKNQSYMDVMIMPYDKYGSLIRSKQTFNKNGWIRKHINQKKNKFLKINPMTGEAYFKYCCFIPHQLDKGLFWKQLIERIQHIQEQLPQLLTKIINLEAKDKPLNFTDQAIESNKLVSSIKLAQILKQNKSIQDQINRINCQNNKLSQKQMLGLYEAYQNQKHCIQSKKINESFRTSNRSTLKSILEDYVFYKRILQNSTIRFNQQNSTQFSFIDSDQKAINIKIKGKYPGTNIKHKIKQCNKQMYINLNLVTHDQALKTNSIIQKLNPDIQYLFLDNFFQQISFQSAIITLALKQMPLKEYLNKNFQSISYQTKFRLLIQVINAVYTLWSKNNIYFHKLDISCFTVTKNLTIKLKDLSNGQYIKSDRMTTDQIVVFYNIKTQIMDSISDIYFEIFFNQKGILSRPQKEYQNGNQDKNKYLFESFNSLTKYYYPNNLFSLIIGLNYFFIERYISSLSQKIYLEAPITQQLIQSNQQMVKKARLGTVRVDLVLTMIIQFLQEHQSSQKQSRGDI